MKSVQIQKVYDWAEEHDAKAQGNFDRYNHDVTLMLKDGSFFRWVCAYAVEFMNADGAWYVVFPEHADIFVVHEDDSVYIDMSKSFPIEPIVVM